jgi:hypothetical protein
MQFVAPLLSALVIVVLGHLGACAEETQARAPLEPSQVYMVNEGIYSGLLVTIQRIDEMPKGEPENWGRLIHVETEIALSTEDDAVWLVSPFIAHMPFSERAIAASPLSLVATEAGPTETFETGYQYWKTQYLKGEAGIFDIPVDDAIGFVMADMESRERQTATILANVEANENADMESHPQS